jgi:uncharacterized protein (DUF2062 family)
VVFRRRRKLGFFEWLREGVWPRAGWRRAIEYIKHRLRRLPDTLEKIGRGIWAGVFASFTPLFGLHFVLSAILAKVMRGNVLAALIGTFFGNPLTFVPIGLVSMNLGHWLLGSRPQAGLLKALPEAFSAGFRDLWNNLAKVFRGGAADWSGLAEFWREVFLPYLVGGIIPGIICATVCYVLTVQLARAHQARRRKRLGRRLAALQKNFGPPP